MGRQLRCIRLRCLGHSIPPAGFHPSMFPPRPISAQSYTQAQALAGHNDDDHRPLRVVTLILIHRIRHGSHRSEVSRSTAHMVDSRRRFQSIVPLNNFPLSQVGKLAAFSWRQPPSQVKRVCCPFTQVKKMGELKDADWMQPFWVCTVWQILTLWRPLTSAPTVRPLSMKRTTAAGTCMAGETAGEGRVLARAQTMLRVYRCDRRTGAF